MNKDCVKDYSGAVERLEEIMQEIQAGAVDVDRLSAVLKEAGELIKFCRARLYKVDEEVQAVLKGLDGDTL